MRRTTLAVIFLTLAIPALALDPPMPRHPALSPDGRQIAFSWQGDLWLAGSDGGRAVRLTAHPAYDHAPVWFPDGRRLAFVSDRENSNDVYVLELPSGQPRRVTFHQEDDRAMGVIGEDLVFLSRRHEAWDRQAGVYRIPAAGGTEEMMVRILAQEAVPSPDGRYLALVRGSTPPSRRHYRGAANRDLWLLEIGTGELARLTETDWDEDGVAWAGNGVLVFRSDNGGDTRNLFRLDLDTKTLTQVTHHQGKDVRFPTTSRDGSLAAYELWDAIYTVSTDGSGEPRRLVFQVPADVLTPAVERNTFRADADQVAISPDGSQVALVVRGNVYVTAQRSKELAAIAPAPTVRVTEMPAREQDVAWGPDGTTLVYASDRDGRGELYRARPAGGGPFWSATRFTEERLTRHEEDDSRPAFSPDGTRLAFVRGRGTLMVADADGRHERTIYSTWANLNFRWSPDSRWLAFSYQDAHGNSEVWIVAADGGEPVNISQHPDLDSDPVWSSDGRRLYWKTRRQQRSMDIWGVFLSRADHERTPEQWVALLSEEGSRSARPGRQGAAAEKDGADPPPPQVVIDFEGLHERAQAVTTLASEVGDYAVSPDGRTLVFAADPDGQMDLYRVRFDGKELTRLTTGGQRPGQLAFSKDGKTVYYRTGRGTVASVGLDGRAGDPVPFAARHEVAVEALRGQVFDEAWRALDRVFYDPDFHGVDWKLQAERYRPLALQASTRRDYEDVMNLMLGELNASHMGFRSPPAEERARTGMLGIEIAVPRDGRGVVVTDVLPDTPAARLDVALRVGDRITAIDGRPLEGNANFFELLADTVDRPIVLEVAGEDGDREAVVTPTGLWAVRSARYREWVRERRALVEEWSEGRLGYIHIQGMNLPSLEEFQRELFAAADGREGLLIDVRNNGGGWTTDYLLAMLMVQRHAWTVPRGADPDIRAYPGDRLPMPAWTRPAAVLADQASFSNAEIFSWAFRTLGRGKVIGMPTFGAVISTGGLRLTDGSFVRLPGRGWYVAGSGINMENNGCPPDVLVAQPPEQDLTADADDQLARAAEVLLAELPADPSLLPW